MFDTLTELAGRLHPAFVHLPIGILVLACCCSIFNKLKEAIVPIIFWGMIGAICSVLTGLALSETEQYEQELLSPHRIAGIVLAAASIILYVLYRLHLKNIILRISATVVLILLIIAGHLGANITHGPDFITSPLAADPTPSPLPPVPDIQHAQVYSQVIQPIFQARCVRCHGDRKQKGKLRLDSPDWIVKGGKSKKTIISGKPDESTMMERLMLPLDDEDHMPPKGKPQLTPEHIALLNWWIATGARFDKKVGELPQTSEMKPVFVALQTGTTIPVEGPSDVPDHPVEKADTAAINSLRERGISILPVDSKSNYLSANFVTVSNDAAILLPKLLPLKNQLVSLQLDGAVLTDSSVGLLSQFKNLRRLQLSNTKISDKDLFNIGTLTQLRSLNLAGTPVTSKGLEIVRTLKNLKHLYLYHTAVDSTQAPRLKKMFPSAEIEMGNYLVPTFATDTSEIKY